MGRASGSRLPADFSALLRQEPIVSKLWMNITPLAQRDWIGWIESAKRPETRARRIVQACSKLKAGKRRPCCYAVIPKLLYQALEANVRAKAGWKQITSEERRDAALWIEGAASRQMRLRRVDEVCGRLSEHDSSSI